MVNRNPGSSPELPVPTGLFPSWTRRLPSVQSSEIPNKFYRLRTNSRVHGQSPRQYGCRGVEQMKVVPRGLFSAIFLTICGCVQYVQYPPSDQGWVKLTPREAAQLEPLLARTPSVTHAVYYIPTVIKIPIDPIYGTSICDGERPLRLDFAGRWRVWAAWPWVGPSGGVGGGQVVIYLHVGGSTYYHYYHGPMIFPGDRPDVTIAATCYNPSRFFDELESKPGDPMSAHVTFR
jgi:hypothetical protein